MERKLPIGIQGFAGLRRDGYLYVDKTAYIYRLVHTGKEYFLSRPRRFGKSLFLSTMKAYWEGKRELFQGLAIEELEKKHVDAWTSYPTFYFDFNGENYREDAALETMIDEHLVRWENQYEIEDSDGSLGKRFRSLLLAAEKKTGLRSVVLVDEYDKPLLEAIHDPELEEHNRAVFKGFFSSLKGFDEHIRFVLISGVTKFEKISIFSDLNQLEDISLDEDYADVCGITETELEKYFVPEIQETAKSRNISVEQCMDRLRRTYDGYRFSSDVAKRTYNPYDLLTALKKHRFGAYWYETGTPTFLVRMLRDSCFDVRHLSDGSVYTTERMLRDYRIGSSDPVPLLYQTGYLTIEGYEEDGEIYTLSIPNEEVKYALMESLIPAYVDGAGAGSGKDILTLRKYLENGETDRIRDVLTAIFASIPYNTEDAPFEHYFQTVVYLVFTLLDQFVSCEMHTWKGRIDCLVKTSRYIYLFEFKRDDTAEAALQQIEEMGYALPFVADPRQLYKIGVSFDSEKRMLADWKVC